MNMWFVLAAVVEHVDRSARTSYDISLSSVYPRRVVGNCLRVVVWLLAVQALVLRAGHAFEHRRGRRRLDAVLLPRLQVQGPRRGSAYAHSRLLQLLHSHNELGDHVPLHQVSVLYVRALVRSVERSLSLSSVRAFGS